MIFGFQNRVFLKCTFSGSQLSWRGLVWYLLNSWKARAPRGCPARAWLNTRYFHGNYLLWIIAGKFCCIWLLWLIWIFFTKLSLTCLLSGRALKFYLYLVFTIFIFYHNQNSKMYCKTFWIFINCAREYSLKPQGLITSSLNATKCLNPQF